MCVYVYAGRTFSVIIWNEIIVKWNKQMKLRKKYSESQ